MLVRHLNQLGQSACSTSGQPAPCVPAQLQHSGCAPGRRRPAGSAAVQPVRRDARPCMHALAAALPPSSEPAPSAPAPSSSISSGASSSSSGGGGSSSDGRQGKWTYKYPHTAYPGCICAQDDCRCRQVGLAPVAVVSAAGTLIGRAPQATRGQAEGLVHCVLACARPLAPRNPHHLHAFSWDPAPPSSWHAGGGTRAVCARLPKAAAAHGSPPAQRGRAH